ncbi:MAG: transporter substrate-binding domain-containing protein [Selenomonadaceae bacterium]|nr:transporter substrate-binding domain-containing protein [Selenomonadaceae bacterium]
MRNLFLPILIFCLLLCITGCEPEQKEIRIGGIKYLNVTEETLDKLSRDNNSKVKRKHIFFDNMINMVAALEAKKIEEMSIYRTVALYFVAHDSDLHWDISEPVVADVFCCAVRAEDTLLKNRLDEAILQITKNGTLTKLVRRYLGEAISGKEPPMVDMPNFPLMPTIRIGVTGDLPLLDYIRPDGRPAGFNTALLAEISRIMNVNFEMVQVESGARAIALTSKQVDVIFWAVVPYKDSLMPENFDTPEGIILTEPYFRDDIVHVKLMKNSQD